MSITSITNTYSPGIRPSAPRVDTGVARPATTNVPQAQPSLPQGTKTGVAAGANALPVEAPKGTDPELWSVLSQSERQFFARAGAMGPLTYGRIMTANHAPPPPVARGGRLDVKV